MASRLTEHDFPRHEEALRGNNRHGVEPSNLCIAAKAQLGQPAQGEVGCAGERPVAALAEEAMGQTLLVVDDDRQMLDLLQVMLSRAGYKVLLADGAVQALDILGREPVSAVVLDIMMPVRSGIEVLEHIRWNPKLADLPVIVLSAAHLSDEEREFVDEFTIGFVDKSHVGDLLKRLQALFGEADPV